MRVKVKRKKIKNSKKDFIKTGIFAILYLFFLAALLAFQGEKSTSYKGLYQTGDDYLKEGKIALAIEHFEQIASNYPNNYKVQVKLAKIYKDAKETDKAKIALFQAMHNSPEDVFDAHREMANLYLENEEYDLAEKVIKQLKKTDPTTHKLKGQFYLKSSKLNKNKQDKILSLKKAYRYLKHSHSKELEETKEKLTEAFLELANHYMNEDNFKESVKTLKTALKYNKTSEVYNRLAFVHLEKDNKKSLGYIKKSIKLDTSPENKELCYELFLTTGKEFLMQGKELYAKYSFQQAKKLNPERAIPYYTDKNLLVNIISTQFNEDREGKIILPGVSFKITNISKEELGYLNTKIVFMNGDKVYSETTKQIATEEEPLPSDSITSAISIFCNKPVKHFDDIKNYSVKIFLSFKKPDKWKLYRYTPLTK